MVEAGRIHSVSPRSSLPSGLSVRDLGDVDLVPGFVDVQVNGGGGVLFNDSPDVEGIRTIVRAHRRFGTTPLLPTFITDELPAMQKAREAVDECLGTGEPGVLGVHFEEPFLDGRKTGAHDAQLVRAPGEDDLALITAGKEGVTHLFNAMSPLESRAHGLVGAALASAQVSCGLILDGVHVRYGAAKVAQRALGSDRLRLVTDAVQPVGSEVTEFVLGGSRVRLENGACVNEAGNLAGSALDMAGAVRNAVHELGWASWRPFGSRLAVPRAFSV